MHPGAQVTIAAGVHFIYSIEKCAYGIKAIRVKILRKTSFLILDHHNP